MRERMRQMFAKAARYAAYLAVAVVVVYVLMRFLAMSSLFAGWSWSSRLLVERTGAPTWLAKALTLLLTIPLAMGMRLVVSWDARKRYAGIALIVALFLAVEFGTRTAARIRRGREPVPGEFFDPVTGDPVVWFCRTSDGGFELSSCPGYHPRTRQPLEPFTAQTAAELATWRERQERERLRQQAEQAARQRAEAVARTEEAKRREAEVRADAEAERRALEAERRRIEEVQFRERYTNIAALPDRTGDGSSIVLCVRAGDGSDEDARYLADLADRALTTAGCRVATEIFTRDFLASDLPDRLLAGDRQLLSRLGLSGRLDRIVFVTFIQEPARPSGIDGYMTVDGAVDVTVIDAACEVRSSARVSAHGPGSTASRAARVCTTRLAESVPWNPLVSEPGN